LPQWEEPIYRRTLAANGFTIKENAVVTYGIRVFVVDTDDVERLARVFRECNTEVRRARAARDQN
jgi:hypothetical protein